MAKYQIRKKLKNAGKEESEVLESGPQNTLGDAVMNGENAQSN